MATLSRVTAGPTRARLARRVIVANLAAQIVIVVTGGLVRLTGSGLGCPSWPQCVPGSYTPVVHQAQGYHKYIEFGNRMLTFVLVVIAVATLVVVVRLARDAGAEWDAGRRRRLVALGAVPLVGVLAQAVLGGVTVRMGLDPKTVAAHFLLSMVLVTASTALLLAVLPRPRWAARPARDVRWLAVGVAVAGAVVLVLGTVVTGSGPHSGDASSPARFGLDPLTVSRTHSGAVWVFAILSVALFARLRATGAPKRVVHRSMELLGLTVVQGAIGYIQYATGLPVALVALHLLGSALVTVAITSAVLPVLTPVVDADAAGRSRADEAETPATA